MKRPTYPADLRLGTNRLARRMLKTKMPQHGLTRRVQAVLPVELWDVYLLEENQPYMQLLPAEMLREIPGQELLAWCLQRARYVLPTIELVDLLSQILSGRRSIEICAGCGDLGRRLGIPMTDADSQQRDTLQIREMLGCPPTILPPDVERLEALAAVDKHQPDVVVGGYVVQKHRAGDGKKGISSYTFGVDEEALLQRVKCYIWIGNDLISAGKRILTKEHAEIRFPGLVTRNADPTKNVIRVWGEMPQIDLGGAGSIRRVRVRL